MLSTFQLLITKEMLIWLKDQIFSMDASIISKSASFHIHGFFHREQLAESICHESSAAHQVVEK